MEGHRISCKGLVSVIPRFSLPQVTSLNKLVLRLGNALRSYFVPFILVSDKQLLPAKALPFTLINEAIL